MKNDAKGTSFRLKDEARFILEQRAEDWGISKTAVIERLLMATESPSEVSSVPQAPEPRFVGTAVSAGFDPSQIAGVQKGPPTGQFPCRCVHSGCRGSKFQGAFKGANLCPSCQETGHRGDARNCERCFEDTGPS